MVITNPNDKDYRELLAQIHFYQKWFEDNKKEDPYPQYPVYGKITQYKEVPLTQPEQRQLRQPGLESLMVPKPIIENPHYKGSGKLKGKVALITGGDSGMVRSRHCLCERRGRCGHCLFR